jgi:hypothetical protein
LLVSLRRSALLLAVMRLAGYAYFSTTRSDRHWWDIARVDRRPLKTRSTIVSYWWPPLSRVLLFLAIKHPPFAGLIRSVVWEQQLFCFQTCGGWHLHLRRWNQGTVELQRAECDVKVAITENSRLTNSREFIQIKLLHGPKTVGYKLNWASNENSPWTVLFILFTNDIACCVADDVYVTLFADDVKMYILSLLSVYPVQVHSSIV